MNPPETMSPATGAQADGSASPVIVNDLTIEAATANGTGSQSANNILAKALFRMGIPVGPKNLFPSNIQGLPTWFNIRVSKDGYTARKREADILVGMNPDSWVKDVAGLRQGAVVLYNSSALSDEPLRERPDLIVYPIPITDLCKEHIDAPKLRRLLANVVYVGALAQLLGIDEDVLHAVIQDAFSNKPKAVAINNQAAQVGIDYAREHFTKRDPYRVASMDGNKNRIMLEGNTICALGSLMAGCTVVGWYPITPSSSLCESLIEQFREYRVDPANGQHRYANVQCEDELASIGVVLGAGWAGARSMTSTAGPGISLMSEFVGFGYYAEIPGVIFNVQRIGPSTGLPTRTSQGDILLCAFNSQGDTQHLCLIPNSPEDAYALSQEAFDLAERYQTPVFVLTDLDLGMNVWMCDRLPYPTKGFDRGKVLDAAALAKVKEFGRYRDVDGDGIPYRTLPGNPDLKASYFTRGSGHDERASYSEDPHVFSRNMDRLKRKIDGARTKLPAPLVEQEDGAAVGLIAYGTTHTAIREARDLLAAQGMATSYFCIRALPLDRDKVRAFLEAHERVYLIEQNRDGQMGTIVRNDIHEGRLTDRLRSVLHYNGLPIDAQTIVDRVLEQEPAR